MAAPDDENIPGDWHALRRVRPEFGEGQGTAWRPTSQAFQELTMAGITAMSVHVDERLQEGGLSATDLLDGFPTYGLAAIRIDDLRQLGLGITWWADESDGARGKAHAHVHGMSSKSLRRKVAALSSVRKIPPSAEEQA
jgi:hypothetical protein